MAVSIDPSSIQINVDDTGVKPLVTIFKKALIVGPHTFPDFVKFHLPHEKPRSGTMNSLVARARAKFLMGPGDTLKGWQVGFFQVVRANAQKATYAGRTPFEGSIVCDPFLKLHSPVVLLDHVESAITKPCMTHPMTNPCSRDRSPRRVWLTVQRWTYR